MAAERPLLDRRGHRSTLTVAGHTAATLQLPRHPALDSCYHCSAAVTATRGLLRLIHSLSTNGPIIGSFEVARVHPSLDPLVPRTSASVGRPVRGSARGHPGAASCPEIGRAHV